MLKKIYISKKSQIVMVGAILLVASLLCIYWIWQKNNAFLADTLGGCTSTSADWEINPCSSLDNPVKARQIVVKVKNPVSGAKFYNVVGTNINTWIDRDEGMIVFPDSITATAATIGSFTLTLSAWTGKPDDGGTKINDFNQTLTVYYDLSYQGLTFHLTADTLDKGDFMIKATPTGQYAGLNNQTTYYVWYFSKADGYLSPAPNKFTTSPERKVKFDTPGVADISVVACSGEVGYTWGEFRRSFSGFGLCSAAARIKLKLKTEAGVIPDDTGSLPTDNVVVSDRIIPGDFKLPLEKDSISVFSGGSISFPVHTDGFIFSNPLNLQAPLDLSYAYRNPQYIEIDLPVAMNLHQQNFESKTRFSEITDGTGNNPIAAGYHRYKIEKIDTNPYGQWGKYNLSLPIYLVFPDSLAGTPNLKIRYRNYTAGQEGRGDLWQEQALNCETIPDDIQLPKRLKTSFGVAGAKNLFVNNGTGKDIDDFLTIYKKLGFNTVPNNGNESNNPVAGDYIYTPEDRQSALWQGLKYEPTYSLFHASYSARGIFGALNPYTTNFYIGLTKDNLDSYAASLDFNAKFRTNLGEPQLSIEKEKWKKAIKFYFDSADSNIGRGVIDMAYDGVILQKSLEDIGNFADTVKPEDISLDSEGYPYDFSWWANTIALSQNAQSRKLAEESNYDLARRIIDEWTAGFTNAIYQKSPNTKIGMYGPRAVYNLGYQVIPWDILQKYNIIPQPSKYNSGHNLDILSREIRSDRALLPQGYRLEPWLGIGYGGEMDSKYVFDQVIHTFLNGATGFGIYSVYELDDMADILEISKAIKIVTPHEDLIMDGQVAFDDISGTVNATVSAMKKDGEYLIGVTPKDKQSPVGFAINTGNATKYRLLDEKTNEYLIVDGPIIEINKTLSSGTVFSLKVETSTPIANPTPTPAPPAPAPASPPAVAPSNYTYTINLKKGINVVSLPKELFEQAKIQKDKVQLSAAKIIDAGTNVYDYNRLGKSIYLAFSRRRLQSSDYLFPSNGYYIYTKQAKDITISLDDFASETGGDNEYMLKNVQMRRGWNLITNSTNSKQKFSNIVAGRLNSNVKRNCMSSSCCANLSCIRRETLLNLYRNRRISGTIYISKPNVIYYWIYYSKKFTASEKNLNSNYLMPGQSAWIYLRY